MKLKRCYKRITYTELGADNTVKQGVRDVFDRERLPVDAAAKLLIDEGVVGRVESVEAVTEVYDIPDEVAAQYKI